MRTKSVKHILGDGTEVNYIRLYAGIGKALTNDGESFWNCVDVYPDKVGEWAETDAPVFEEHSEFE